MSAGILLSRDGPIATLSLNRPQSLNALDFGMMDALVAHSRTIAADASIGCVILRGEGPHFMAGGDIKVFDAELVHPGPERERRFQQMIDRLHASIENFAGMSAPIVGSVHGAVAGFGLSLASACDLLIAADDAFFTTAYRHIGLTPDGGGTWFLPRAVGLKKAMELVLLGDRFDARTAMEIGLVNRVVPAADLAAETAKVAAALASGPRQAIANAKRLLNGSFSHSLARQLHAEAESFGACAATDDFAEGIRAFVEKRKPVFGR